jgi:hypothetical protein
MTLLELRAPPHPPQDVYRAYIDKSEIFIGIYWQKYGRIAPGGMVSGFAARPPSRRQTILRP